MSLEKIIKNYVHTIYKNPKLVMGIFVVVFMICLSLASRVQTVTSDYGDMIPSGLDEIVAFDIVEDSFGSTENAKIIIMLDPKVINSSEPRDIRSPEVLQYINILTEYATNVDEISSTESMTTSLKLLNEDVLPKDKKTIKEIIKENPNTFRKYISEDYTLTVINVNFEKNFDVYEAEKELNKIIDAIKKPSGLNVQLGGDVMSDPIVMDLMKEDMGKTSQFSLIIIVVVLLVMFRSLKYGFMPLATIGIGVVITFAYLGLIGQSITSQTSGVISMIMGIGIDFGIQVVMRFRDEVKKLKTEDAMATTLNSVFLPMTTTTIAAVIGFRAMGLGELTMLAEMGKMMSYGVISCYFVAITFIPALLMFVESFNKNKIKAKINKKIKKRIKLKV